MSNKPRDPTPEELKNIGPSGEKVGENPPQKQRVGENPKNPEADGLPIGNGATGKPAVFPPHN